MKRGDQYRGAGNTEQKGEKQEREKGTGREKGLPFGKGGKVGTSKGRNLKKKETEDGFSGKKKGCLEQRASKSRGISGKRNPHQMRGGGGSTLKTRGERGSA